jgi:P-type Ca2+ transporter type 2C
MPDNQTGIGNFSGLSGSDLHQLTKQYGKNVFKADKNFGFFHTVKDIIAEPMFIMLLIACSIYFVLGESDEGFLMLVAIFFVAAISIYQEVKSSKALMALKQFTEPKVVVIRDREEQIIFSEDLLPGDIMKLEEGKMIPADGVAIQSNDLTVNESILTGESIPVEKNIKEGSNQLFQGTTINSGMCYVTVTSTGNQTRLGKLGKSISQIANSKTLLQDQIGRFVKIMAFFGFTAFAVIWFVNFLHSGEVIQSLLLGLTLAMSAVPEEIPVAFSSFMALGTSHMTKLGIITRQPQTIENLGAVSVICLDKTGTITENKMQVKKLYDFDTGQLTELNDHLKLKKCGLLWYARLASEKDPFDTMEKAIVEACHIHLDPENCNDLEMVHEYPLGGQPPMMTHVYESDGRMLVAAKGAPERILAICSLDSDTVRKLGKVIQELGSSGYRVLGVCKDENHTGPFPGRQDDFHWKFAGLLALYDPPKQNVREVFKKWHHAGIRVKMVTGDYMETALNIASQTGIHHSGQGLTGEQVMNIPSKELQGIAKNTNIYARMFPEAKLKLVEAIKANGEIVAMTGDGVNDAPALRSAQIGIAMGSKGTEMAKEAGDLIITDDNLDKITDAIQQGRKIYNNLKKAIRYIISIHIPIIFTASLPLLLGWKYPNIFTPIHIIFLELIMGPTCSIFYEREPAETNLMDKHPRPPKQNMFSGKELLISIVQGLVITTGLLTQYFYYMQHGYSIEYVRTVVFTTLILSNILLTFCNRSFEEPFHITVRYKNSLVPFALSISVIFLLTIYFVSPVRNIFRMTDIGFRHYLVCLLVSLICSGWFELYKLWLKHRVIPIKNQIQSE